MPNERWQGRFVVEYDDVDVEQFGIEAGDNGGRKTRQLIVRDARERAEKACQFLKLRTVNIGGENARIIFITETAQEAGRRSARSEEA